MKILNILPLVANPEEESIVNQRSLGSISSWPSIETDLGSYIPDLAPPPRKRSDSFQTVHLWPKPDPTRSDLNIPDIRKWYSHYLYLNRIYLYPISAEPRRLITARERFNAIHDPKKDTYANTLAYKYLLGRYSSSLLTLLFKVLVFDQRWKSIGWCNE